jgi:hypothetical protein
VPLPGRPVAAPGKVRLVPDPVRILYVSQYFPPEAGAPPARVHELARAWVAAGHDVNVLTAFPHHATGIERKKGRGVLTRRETVDGIDVIRSYVFAAARVRFAELSSPHAEA